MPAGRIQPLWIPVGLGKTRFKIRVTFECKICSKVKFPQGVSKYALDIAHTMGHLIMQLKIPKMSLNFRKWQYYGIWSKICHFWANSEFQKMALEALFFYFNGLRGCNNVTWGCTDRKTLGIESPAPKMAFWAFCWIFYDSPKKNWTLVVMKISKNPRVQIFYT